MNALYIVTTYVVLDDTLKAMHYQDDVRARVTTAEILTVAVLAARYFQNHHERALWVLQQIHAIPRLSTSRFNRRLHQVQVVFEHLVRFVSQQVAQTWLCCIDTLPLPICKRVRLERCRKAQGKMYLSWCASKREWYFGWQLHWVCDLRGVPFAFEVLPASWHELTLVQDLLVELPPYTMVLGDKGYLSKIQQALAWQTGQVYLLTPHQRHMKPLPTDAHALLAAHRHTVETAHSRLEKMGVQRLHAPTHTGFLLKLFASLFALTIQALTGN